MPSSVPGTEREPMLALGNDGIVLSSDHAGWPQGTRHPRVEQDINSQQTWETWGCHGQPLPLPWPHKSSQVPPDRTAAFLRGTMAGHPTARGLLARGKCMVWSASGPPSAATTTTSPVFGWVSSYIDWIHSVRIGQALRLLGPVLLTQPHKSRALLGSENPLLPPES